MNNFRSTSDTKLILETIKEIMISRKLRYSELSRHLGLSIATIKRQLSADDVNLSRLNAIAGWLGMSLMEIMNLAQLKRSEGFLLTTAQEEFFIQNASHFSYLLYLARGYSVTEISKKFKISVRSTQKYLKDLEDNKLIVRQPDDKVSLLDGRGPIHHIPGGMFEKHYLPRYLHEVEKGCVAAFSGRGLSTSTYTSFATMYLPRNSLEKYIVELKDLVQRYTLIPRQDHKLSQEHVDVFQLFYLSENNFFETIFEPIKDL